MQQGDYGIKRWPKRGDVEWENSYKFNAGLPWKHRYTYIDKIMPKNEGQAQVMDDLFDLAGSRPMSRYQSLVVHGSNGTGKSYLGCGFVNSLLAYVGRKADEYDFQPMYVNEADLLIRITSYKGRDWFGVYSDEARFLVIDEFGMVQWTTAENRRIEQLLNKRFSNGYKTVILTNLSSEELFNKISSQLRSRLQTGRERFLSGPDLRAGDPLDYGEDW